MSASQDFKKRNEFKNESNIILDIFVLSVFLQFFGAKSME